MASVNINLSDDLQQFVLVQTQVGQFHEPSDYIESLIAQAKQNKDSLESLLEEGLDSGEPIVLDAVEWKSIRDEFSGRVQ
jgi:antitoxin ParD1/3/4